MKKILIPLFFSIFITTIGKDRSIENIDKVNILPLGQVDQKYLKEVETIVETFYKVDCKILPNVKLSNDILTKSKKRYDALKILKKYKNTQNTLVITEKDIATKYNGLEEWGVLGLGFRPGNICVLSTFRMKKNVSNQKMIDRLRKVSIHEIGHNLGLDHCSNNKKCVMNDAKGKISTIDNEEIWLCEKCRSLIN